MNQWPKHDQKLKLADSWVRDLDAAMGFVTDTSTCIQAGGAAGLWPAYLSKHFDRVYTFEPEHENFACLVANCPQENIIKMQAALGCTRGQVSLNLHTAEQHNAGAWYATPDGNIPILQIDDLGLDEVGFIQLDIEGSELNALMGAVETVKRCGPVVMLEEKPLPQGGIDPSAARKWLEWYGYKVAGRVHNDVIMARKC